MYTSILHTKYTNIIAYITAIVTFIVVVLGFGTQTRLPWEDVLLSLYYYILLIYYATEVKTIYHYNYII